MTILKTIAKLVLFPVWIILVITGILVKIIVHAVTVIKSAIVGVIVILTIATMICYKDWIQVLFLISLIISACLVMFGSVFAEVLIDVAREKVEEFIKA